MNVVDSSGWIEFFRAGANGPVFKPVIEDRKGRVLDFTDARAVAAAHIAARHKLAMADAAMYAMAREFDATFWTQDADCQGLDGVRYQPKPGA